MCVWCVSELSHICLHLSCGQWCHSVNGLPFLVDSAENSLCTVITCAS